MTTPRIKAPTPEQAHPYSPNVMHDDHGRPLFNTPKLIVVHGTVGPCQAGQRYVVAREFLARSREASAHYIVDPAGVLQDVPDHQVADHCGLNPDSIGIEHTFELPSPAWDKAHAARWKDHNHQEVLRRGANLTARLGMAYGIPLRRVTPEQIRAWVAGGRRHPLGVCGHVDISAAFPEFSTHWDPGPAFPWGEYMAAVVKHAAYLQKKAKART